MSEHFEVGEVAILVALNPALKEFDGCDVTVEGPLEPQGCMGRADMYYPITTPDGRRRYSVPKGLRKKPKPPAPREAVGEWDSCPWQPAREVETA